MRPVGRLEDSSAWKRISATRFIYIARMSIAHDYRAAWRNLRRSGWLPAVVVLMLALAIGAVTAAFSIAHAVLLRPLPVADPDRVVLLWGRDDARSQSVVEVSLLDMRAWRAGQKSFSAIRR
jgi:hypothetical protein